MWFQGITAIIIVGIAAVFMDSARCQTMPALMHDLLIWGFVTTFLIFLAYILQEKPSDEREAFLTLKSGRTAYVAGLIILMTGIVIQTINHQSDPWLIGAAVVMVMTKVTASWYFRRSS